MIVTISICAVNNKSYALRRDHEFSLVSFEEVCYSRNRLRSLLALATVTHHSPLISHEHHEYQFKSIFALLYSKENPSAPKGFVVVNPAVFCCAIRAIGSDGTGSIIREEVDLIEVNHFHDDLGRHVYDQVVFYSWSKAAGDYHVRSWCLLDDPSRWPRKNLKSGKYHVFWFDRDQRLQREILAKHYLETWTQVDPERANKRLLDEKYRTAFYRPSTRVQRQAVPNVARVNHQTPANVR
jgi:hypothetical protein